MRPRTTWGPVARSVEATSSALGDTVWIRDHAQGWIRHEVQRSPRVRDEWIHHPDLGWGRVAASGPRYVGVHFRSRTAWFSLEDPVVLSWPTLVSPGRPEEVSPPTDAQRRSALCWMLHLQGVSYTDLGRAIGLSDSGVRRACLGYGRILHRRIEDTPQEEDDPIVRRLQLAGALPPRVRSPLQAARAAQDPDA